MGDNNNGIYNVEKNGCVYAKQKNLAIILPWGVFPPSQFVEYVK